MMKYVMSMYEKLRHAGFALILFSLISHSQANEVNTTNSVQKSANEITVVTTIRPLYLVAKSLLNGIDTNVELINDDFTSPHDLRIKPSQHRLIEKADAIFYIDDENYETFLTKPLENKRQNQGKARPNNDKQFLVKLSENKNMELLPYRQAEDWHNDHDKHDHDKKGHKEHDHDKHDHDKKGHKEHDHDKHDHDKKGHKEHDHDKHDHEKKGHKEQHDHDKHDHEKKGHKGHDHHNHDHSGMDSHIWLGHHNGEQIIKAMSQTLSKLFANDAVLIKQNTQKMLADWQTSYEKLSAKLKGVNQPYLVFHDAYQYFEKNVGLKPVGSIVVETDQPISAKRIKGLQKRINKHNIRCILHEPQFSKKIIDTIKQGVKLDNSEEQIVIEEVDPLGNDAQQFHQIREMLGNSIAHCLSDKHSH